MKTTVLECGCAIETNLVSGAEKLTRCAGHIRAMSVHPSMRGIGG